MMLVGSHISGIPIVCTVLAFHLNVHGIYATEKFIESNNDQFRNSDSIDHKTNHGPLTSHGHDPDRIIRLPSYSEFRYKVPDNSKKSAKILFWTPIYSNRAHWFWWFNQQQLKNTCPDINCEFTIDNSQLNSSDALLFFVYRGDFNFENNFTMETPPYRFPNQRYVFYLTEPPDAGPYRNMSKLNGFFNWTMTYRKDSDAVAHYGKIILNKIPQHDQELQSMSRDYTEGKTKLLTWVVGHCETDGKRENFVKEMQTYLSVDIYGNCGTMSCEPPRSTECYEKFAREYKFYISFENILCKDYVTEKFMGILKYDIVPIVFGGADYSEYAPKGSYINALDFSGPKELAEYVLYLDQNKDEYNRFFDWKRGYIPSIQVNSLGICELCIKLMDPDEPPKIYEDIDTWWNMDGDCAKWESSKVVKIPYGH